MSNQIRTSYAAAKAGLIAMTRTWATELAPTGITVNAIAPGPTETELFRANNPPGSENELISYWDNADWYRQLGKTSLDT